VQAVKQGSAIISLDFPEISSREAAPVPAETNCEILPNRLLRA